jgi:tRNA pseudouridine65 synthase
VFQVFVDRKTSGVLLFAIKEVLKIMNDRFMTREVKYLAIFAGWSPEELTIDYDLTNDDGIIQNAQPTFIDCKLPKLS